MEKINVLQKAALFSEHWSPKILADLNDQHIKIAKLKGEFGWHAHEAEDELFYVIAGSFELRLRDRSIHLQEQEFFVVPRGVEHNPVAEAEATVLLIEPKSTLNTGNVENEKTVTEPDRI